MDAELMELVMDAVMNRLKPIDVRRAVLSVFMRRSGGPLTIDEIVRLTHELAGLDLAALGGVAPHRRVSDIMRHQVRKGRAEVHWQRVNEARGRSCLPRAPGTAWISREPWCSPDRWGASIRVHHCSSPRP